jgi:hypothetical protein
VINNVFIVFTKYICFSLPIDFDCLKIFELATHVFFLINPNTKGMDLVLASDEGEIDPFGSYQAQ